MGENEYKVLTKADLIGGKKAVRSVYFEDLGGSLPLRPLTELEWTEAQRILFAAITATGNPDALRRKKGNLQALQDSVDFKFDLGTLTAAEAAQTAHVVSCGVELAEKLTPAEVREMAPGVAEKIAQKIYEISRITPAKKEEITNFRKK